MVVAKGATQRRGMTPQEEMQRIEKRLAEGSLTDQERWVLASRWNELKTEEDGRDALVSQIMYDDPCISC